VRGPIVGEEVVRYVADPDPRAAEGEEVAYRPPNARGAGGHEDAQTFSQREDVGRIVHEGSAPIRHVRFSRSAMTATRTTRPNTIVRVA
jgi:hypothetical protein